MGHSGLPSGEGPIGPAGPIESIGAGDVVVLSRALFFASNKHLRFWSVFCFEVGSIFPVVYGLFGEGQASIFCHHNSLLNIAAH